MSSNGLFLSKRAAAVLLACFCTVLAAYSIRYSYGTLLPEMLGPLSITKAQAGIIYSCYFIAYTLLSPILGLLADRFDLRVLLAVFVGLMGAGTFLMQYPSSVWQAAAFFTLAGIGCAACWAPVMALAQRWINDKRRGLSLAFVDAGSSLGVMAAGALVPLAVAGAGWQMGWRGLGIFTLVLAAVNFILVRSYPENAGGKAARSIPLKIEGPEMSYGQILRDRRFWLIGLAYLLTGFAIIIPFTFLSTYAVKELSFSYESAALLVTIIGIGAIIGKLLLGAVSDRLGRIKIMVLCAVLIMGGCAGLACTSGWLLAAVCFIYGAGYGACWAMYAACASDFFSKKVAGGIIGLWTFLMGIGSIVAPVLAGWSADTSGTLRWAFVIASAAGGISLVLLLPLLKAQQSSTVRSKFKF